MINDVIKSGFVNCMYVIVMVYFAYFESFIVYRNTHRPRYVHVSINIIRLIHCKCVWDL